MRLATVMFALVAALAAPLQAVPPLTPEQREQLASATDGVGPDEAALYPLLDNAMQWQPGDEAGAAIPDYAVLLGGPEAHRGKLFLIEGIFAGVPEDRKDLKVGRLSRPGPWEDSLEDWGIVLQRDPPLTLVVLLVAPPETPRRETPVRVAARFYKLWETQNRRDEPMRYPVFVGHSATVVGKPAMNQGPPWGVMVVILVLAGFGFYQLRRTVGQARRRPVGHRRDTESPAPREPSDDEPSTQPPLPEDPVDALDELQRRRAAPLD